MPPSTLLTTATILFGIAGLGGLLMAGMRLVGVERPPVWLAMLHGFLAASGLTLLLYAAFTIGIPAIAQYGLGLLLLAAASGATLNLFFHWKLRPLPIPLMIVHAMLAVIGFLLLATAIFWQTPR